jgi:hypothetical protein
MKYIEAAVRVVLNAKIACAFGSEIAGRMMLRVYLIFLMINLFENYEK